MPDPRHVKKTGDLCLACGMCCDGTLFDFVRLESADNVALLKKLGMPVTRSRGKDPVSRFAQPCHALCKDRTCRIYTDRPSQCRSYECGVLKDVKADRTSLPDALQLVKRVRRRADDVRRFLRSLGDQDEHRALGERFHRTTERMEAKGTSPEQKAAYADLALAVHRLKLDALERFYS
jgi:uncharacterized protein